MMRRTLSNRTAAALAVFAAAAGGAAANTANAAAAPRPVNPDWPPIPMDEELFDDQPDLVARTSDFVQYFYECLSRCSTDDQLRLFHFPAKIVLPAATIRDAAQYRAYADREQRGVDDPDRFVNTFKATGDASDPVVHVTVLYSGTRRGTGESFRFLADEQLQLLWDGDTGSYAVTRYQINTMAPA